MRKCKHSPRLSTSDNIVSQKFLKSEESDIVDCNFIICSFDWQHWIVIVDKQIAEWRFSEKVTRIVVCA